MSDRKIVTRFAPSPTGYLHIGGARTALFNWAFARRHNGTFILRIEDTDKARSTPEATRRIIEDMQWLGLDWDEGPDPAAPDVYALSSQRGARGPYFQSQRDHLYKEYLQKLLDLGRAYPENGAYRFRMPRTDITVNDLVLGDVTIKSENLEDFIIMKGEAGGGGPTFHFANVVDDATMGVTHVLRAQEHLMNTPKHVAMFDALGIPRPQYAHMPLIFNPDSSKMSKRDKAKVARQAAKAKALTTVESVPAETFAAFLDKKRDDAEIAVAVAAQLGLVLPEIDVHDFRVAGYLQEVLLNYVALLGWSPGGDLQRFDLDWFKSNFAIEGIGKSNAKFDREKLKAFNGDTLAKLPPEVFAGKLKAHLRTQHAGEFGKLVDHPQFALFAQAFQQRAKTLSEPAGAGRFFVVPDDTIAFDPKAVEKVLRKGNGVAVLRELEAVLAALPVWTSTTLHEALEAFGKQTNRGLGDVAQPLRVAVTGATVSPPIQDTLAILGKEPTLARIRRCIAAHAA